MPCRIDCFSTTYRRKLAAATATAVATAPVICAEIWSIATIRVWNKITGNRAIPAEPAYKFRIACVDCRSEICVLRRLRSRKFQRLIFRLKRGNLILREEIEDCVRAVALCVDNVARAGVDGILNIAGIFCHAVLNILLSRFQITAAGSKLAPKLIKCALNGISELANALVNLIVSLHNSGIYTVKSLAQSLLNTRLTEFQVVER